MTPERLQELRELEKKATPGPWEVGKRRTYGIVTFGDKNEEPGYDTCLRIGIHENCITETAHDDQFDKDGHNSNVELIAAMRNNLPELLDAAEENAAPRWGIDYLAKAGVELAAKDAEIRRLRDALSSTKDRGQETIEVLIDIVNWDESIGQSCAYPVKKAREILAREKAMGGWNKL